MNRRGILALRLDHHARDQTHSSQSLRHGLADGGKRDVILIAFNPRGISASGAIDLAYVEGRGSVAGRRLSWNVAGDPTQ